jgi:hypothetical protein
MTGAFMTTHLAEVAGGLLIVAVVVMLVALGVVFDIIFDEIARRRDRMGYDPRFRG